MQIYKLRDKWKSRNQSRQKKWNQKAMRKIWETICSTAKKQRKQQEQIDMGRSARLSLEITLSAPCNPLFCGGQEKGDTYLDAAL